MTSTEYSEFVEKALRRQQEAVRFQVFFASALVCLGLLALLIVNVLPHSFVADGEKLLMSVAATFISTLCGFPVHEISGARGRIDALETLARSLARATADGTSLDPRLEDRIWKTFDRALGH